MCVWDRVMLINPCCKEHAGTRSAWKNRRSKSSDGPEIHLSLYFKAPGKKEIKLKETLVRDSGDCDWGFRGL